MTASVVAASLSTAGEVLEECTGERAGKAFWETEAKTMPDWLTVTRVQTEEAQQTPRQVSKTWHKVTAKQETKYKEKSQKYLEKNDTVYTGKKNYQNNTDFSSQIMRAEHNGTKYLKYWGRGRRGTGQLWIQYSASISFTKQVKLQYFEIKKIWTHC